MYAKSMCARWCVTLLAAVVGLSAATPGVGRAQSPAKLTPPEILAAAAEKGKALLAALPSYSYYAETTIETVSQADTISGKYYRFSQISFGGDGRRQERVIDNASTVPEDVRIGTNTADNLTRVYQFTLTPESLNVYEFNYVGRERVDELSAYVFDVRPKVKAPDADKGGERYWQGRLWVDEQDLCVVKVEGRVLTEPGAHRAPKFETYYQNVDQFWFPAYVTADDRVRSGKYWTRVVVKLRFTSYRREAKKG